MIRFLVWKHVEISIFGTHGKHVSYETLWGNLGQYFISTCCFNNPRSLALSHITPPYPTWVLGTELPSLKQNCAFLDCICVSSNSSNIRVRYFSQKRYVIILMDSDFWVRAPKLFGLIHANFLPKYWQTFGQSKSISISGISFCNSLKKESWKNINHSRSYKPLNDGNIWKKHNLRYSRFVHF